MKLELVVRKDVSHVELMKDDRTPLGLKIRDGIEDETGPVIKKVKSKSLAERSHAVAKGDIVLSLNGREVIGARAVDVRRMMKEAGPEIDLKVHYAIREVCISHPGVYRKQRMTTKLHKEGDSFGFVLRKKISSHPFSVEYPVISHIKEGGPAHKDSQMQEGDHLLRVDDVGLNWLSLVDVASLLQERDEAEFTFEYNVRVVNICIPEDKPIDLEINVPITDLGIGICLFSSNSNNVYIGSIRLGSIAERCGMFSEGDIILSINGIDLESTDVAKANSFLRNARKIRKLSFISRRNFPQSGYFSGSHDEKYITSSSPIGVEVTDYNHVNPPVNSPESTPENTPESTQCSTLSSRHKSHFTEFCYGEQVKIVKKFQNIIKHMTGLKQNLSRLTHVSFDGGKMHTNDENCTACNRTQHSVKLCTSCLSRMNVKCAQSMDFLKNIITLFVSVFRIQENTLTSEDVETKTEPNTMGVNCLGSVVSKNMIHSLEETLPMIFIGNPERQNSFRAMAEKIVNANNSGSTCKYGINSASLTVKKLLLLVSLNDQSANIKALINQLVYCLLETKVTCCEDSDSPDSSHDSETSDSQSENSSQSSILPSGEGASLEDETHFPLNITEEAAREMQSNETDLKEKQYSERSLQNSQLNINLNTESAFFKITNIASSDSENTQSLNEFDETKQLNLNHSYSAEGASHGENFAATSETNLLEDYTQSNKSKNFAVNTDKKIFKDKGLRSTPAKVWKSLDMLLNLKKSFRIKPETRNDSDQNSNPAETRKSKEVNPFAASGCSYENPPQHVPSNLGSKKYSKSNKESNKDSTRHSHPTTNEDIVEPEKVRVETVVVKITKDEGGFGFILGFSSDVSDTLPVPIITAVKPKSAAHRVGILQKKDRVLAINHKSIVGISLKDLENLKRKFSSLDHVTLKVEFDVVDAELKFGTFDVVLDRKLIVGLEFEDMMKGSPVVVKGVVKGSAAHRSGQLFRGDKVTFMKYVRNEELDTASCDYYREEYVRMTVERNPTEGIEEMPIQPPPLQSHPFSYNPGSNPLAGINFIVRHTSVHSSKSDDVLVLDQEITLFRDPASWDFGLQTGVDPDTGRSYVTDVKPDGPASASGVIKKFDRIVEVNGIVVGRSCSALTLFTEANEKVDLLIRRSYHEDKNNPLKHPSHQNFSFL